MFRKSECFLVAIWMSCTFVRGMTEIETLTSGSRRCSYERVFEMMGANCAGLKMDQIPSLKGGIEVLDFSDNKLRKIQANTFYSYSSIKYLYLADNQIYFVHKDAFSPLSSLQILDLSKNTIMDLNPSIFQLPSLIKLKLGGNPLFNLVSNLATLQKPIKAPLDLLDLSNCELQRLPDLGILPNLAIYNISQNPLVGMEANLFAKACNLAKVDITKAIDNVPLCELKTTITWLDENHIAIVLENYTKLNSKEFHNCPEDEISYEKLNSTLRQCKSEPLKFQSRRVSRSTWLTIGGGLAGFLVGFMLLLFLVHRCNVARMRRAANKAAPPDGDRKATAVLLHNVS